jgi:hypothetical protein
MHFGTYFTLTLVAKKSVVDFRSTNIKGEGGDDCTIPQKPILARQGGCHDMSTGMNLA